MTKQILNAQDVSDILEVSSSKAYSIIRQLNGELKERGFLTVPGKVSRVYFEEKLYGVHITE